MVNDAAEHEAPTTVYVALEDVERIATVIARTAIAAWEERQALADARLFGWAAITAEVSRLRGLPTPRKTIHEWARRKRFPLDKGLGGNVSVVRGEVERWMRISGTLPAARKR